MIVVINVAFIQMSKYVRMRGKQKKQKKLELTGIGWKMKNYANQTRHKLGGRILYITTNESHYSHITNLTNDLYSNSAWFKFMQL